jgi:hypothetical protein
MDETIWGGNLTTVWRRWVVSSLGAATWRVGGKACVMEYCLWVTIRKVAVFYGSGLGRGLGDPVVVLPQLARTLVRMEELLFSLLG